MKKKVTKIANHNTIEPKGAKKALDLGETCFNFQTGDQQWFSKNDKRQFADSLLKYVNVKKNCYTICEYFDNVGVGQRQYRRWMKDDRDVELQEYLLEKYDAAKRVLGRRLYCKAVDNNHGVNTAATYLLPLLNEEWKHEDERREQQKKDLIAIKQSADQITDEVFNNVLSRFLQRMPDTNVPNKTEF